MCLSTHQCVFVNVQAEVAAAAATVAALSGERDSHRAAAEEAVQRANVSASVGDTHLPVVGLRDSLICAAADSCAGLQKLFVGCACVRVQRSLENV